VNVLTCFHRRRLYSLLVAALLAPSPSNPLAAQPARNSFPAATTIAALVEYPGFYHQRQVVVRGEATTDDKGFTRLAPPGGLERGIWLLVRDGQAPEGQVEVRGQFLDVGRFDPEDSQTQGLGLPTWVSVRIGDRWPAHGEMLALNVVNSTQPAPPTSTPTIRQLALDPERYAGQKLSVAGQFGGRNLFGDVAQSPRVGRFEFVLRAAGGAVWVTGMEPRGRGWRLNPDARVDTSQWLKATGTVRTANGLVWIEAEKLEKTTEREQEAPPPPPPAPAPAPPPEAIFSLPSNDDTDVPPESPVRIQFSRDLDPATFGGRIVVGYEGQAPGTPGIPFNASFDRSNRVLRLAFERPLEPYRTVRVELREGILGTDGQPLAPMTLRFTVGG
jgi:hypothetical protein